MIEGYYDYEIENGIPEHWETNIIYKREPDGNVIRVEVPDDEKEA